MKSNSKYSGSELLKEFEQKEIKWELINSFGGAVFNIIPDTELSSKKSDDVLFFIENTCVGFFVSNWKQFFKNKKSLFRKGRFNTHIQVVGICPSAINEDGPFIGHVEIIEIFD
jgi:hypothetical protein